jgi:hypothetical protein
MLLKLIETTFLLLSDDWLCADLNITYCEVGILPTPGEAKAKAMPGRLYIHAK